MKVLFWGLFVLALIVFYLPRELALRKRKAGCRIDPFTHECLGADTGEIVFAHASGYEVSVSVNRKTLERMESPEARSGLISALRKQVDTSEERLIRTREGDMTFRQFRNMLTESGRSWRILPT